MAGLGGFAFLALFYCGPFLWAFIWIIFFVFLGLLKQIQGFDLTTWRPKWTFFFFFLSNGFDQKKWSYGFFRLFFNILSKKYGFRTAKYGP